MAPKATLTTPRIKTLAGRGLKDPLKLTPKEVQEICGSVMEHINRTESK